MPDFSAISKAIGAVADILSGVTGFVGSVEGDGFSNLFGSLESEAPK